MYIDSPDTSAADTLADCWVDLANEQHQYDAHLAAEANRQEIRERLLRSIVTDGIRVAWADDEIIGFVMFSVKTGGLHQLTRRGTIHNLYVKPNARNTGIGSKLIETAEAALAERGVETITLDVMAKNEDARRFYRRHGYKPHRVTLTKPIESDNHSKEKN